MTIDIATMKLPTHDSATVQTDKNSSPINPSIVLFRACKVLLHKLRIEFDRKSLISRLKNCEEAETAARCAQLAAENKVKEAEEALKEAKRALEEAKQTAQKLVDPLHKAVTETDKVKRELSMLNAEVKKCDIEYEAEERALGQAYKEAVALSQLAIQAMHLPAAMAMPAAPTVQYPAVNGNAKPQSHSVASPVLDPSIPTSKPESVPVNAAQKAEDEPKKPTPEERSDKFIDALADLLIDAPGEVYIDGRTYFFVGDLTRIFSPDLKDPNKSGSAHARNYGTLDGGAYREGVRKQAGRWVMTLEAFEAYVLPHLRTVRFIKY